MVYVADNHSLTNAGSNLTDLLFEYKWTSLDVINQSAIGSVSIATRGTLPYIRVAYYYQGILPRVAKGRLPWYRVPQVGIPKVHTYFITEYPWIGGRVPTWTMEGTPLPQ